MVGIELRLLGGFAGNVEGGQTLGLTTKKTWALLAYLALQPGRELSREYLATLLWGDRFDEQARRSLRQALYELRSALGESAGESLATTRETAALSGVEVDVARFETLAASGEAEQLAEAEQLYRGALLQGLEIGVAEFDGWLAGERARLQELACNALERLAAHRLNQGMDEAGLETARGLVKLDPLNEGGHRLVMRGLAAGGRRSEALKHYQKLESLLRAELETHPDMETTALREAIRQGGGEPPATDDEAPDQPAMPGLAGKPWRKGWRVPAALAIAALLIAGAAVSYVSLHGPKRLAETASEARMAYPLPAEPSIAVLPFENLSDDPRQDRLARGLTEDLITALSKVPRLFVVARTSTTPYKDKPVTVQQVAEDLGVRYVFEGSVQKTGEGLRVTVQLIDAISGFHLWGERFDREARQIFALQDEIVRRTLVELQVKLSTGDHARMGSRGTTNLEAWLLRLQAVDEIYKFTRESTIRARELLQAAHQLDPNWSRPLGGIAWSYWWEAKKGWTDDREEWIRRGIEFAERAIDADPENTIGYMQLGNLAQLQGDHDQAIALREKAVELAPNDFQANWGLGSVLFRAGHAERAVEVMKRARRLSPRHPPSLVWDLSQAQMMAGQYEDAIETAKRAEALAPDHIQPHIQLAVSYSALDRMEDARGEAAEMLHIDPDFNISGWKRELLEYKDQAGVERLGSLLAKAGLPE